MTTAGVVTTTDTWLVHRLCGAFVTDASTASRSLLIDLDTVDMGRRAAGACSGWPARRCPRSSAATRSSAAPTFSAPAIPVAGLIVDQQAALLAESCLTPGDAKCTFGTGAFLLAQLGGNAGAVDVGPDHLGGLAAARAHVLLRRRSGLHRGLRGALGQSTSGWSRRRPNRRLARSRLQRRRAVRARAGRAGGALVGLDGHRIVHRDDAEQRARTTGARAAGRHRRPGRRAG